MRLYMRPEEAQRVFDPVKLAGTKHIERKAGFGWGDFVCFGSTRFPVSAIVCAMVHGVPAATRSRWDGLESAEVAEWAVDLQQLISQRPSMLGMLTAPGVVCCGQYYQKKKSAHQPGTVGSSLTFTLVPDLCEGALDAAPLILFGELVRQGWSPPPSSMRSSTAVTSQFRLDAFHNNMSALYGSTQQRLHMVVDGRQVADVSAYIAGKTFGRALVCVAV
jgi:hypothetical protein